MANLILTPEWVEGIYQLETSDPVMGGPDGIDNRQAIQLGKRTEFLKKEIEKCSPINNPIFTGTPKAPTPAQTVNDEQIATTAFVKAAIAALVGSAPATLDTLAEIAVALGNDGNLKQVLLGEIGKKVNLTDFTALKDLLVGIPFPYPLSAVPSGCLAFNGQTFSTSLYPTLAQKYSSGRLPDLRGEFIRGWDNGRGVDNERGVDGLLSYQNHEMTAHRHYDEYFINSGATINDPVFNASAYAKEFTAPSTSKTIYKRNSTTSMTGLSSSLVGGNETRPRNIAFQYICLAA